MGKRGTPDQRADQLSARQHGVINRRQALEAGLTAEQVKERLRNGRWHSAARGTYVAPGSMDSWQRKTAVAWLTGPTGTVVSHLSGAALLGLGKPPPVPHVTVPRAANGRFQGAVIHHGDLESVDLCTASGIRCTRPARTVVDCAALLTYEAVCDMVDDLLCRAPHTPSSLRQAMARASERGVRKGFAHLDRALEVWAPGPRPGSRQEMRLVRQLQAWGFPLPERQMEIFDHGGRLVARVDLGYLEPLVILEYYGQRHHGPRRAAHDELRQRRIEALGGTVVVVDKYNLHSAGLRSALSGLFGDRVATRAG